MKNVIRTFIIISFLGLIVTGCAMIEEQEAKQTERMLIASGFMIQSANTPEQIAQLDAQPQRELIMHYKDGEPRYIYANSYESCMYVGDQKANQKYQELRIQQEIAARNQATAETSQNTAFVNQKTACANENAANMNREAAAMNLRAEREKKRKHKHKCPKMDWGAWDSGTQMQP